MVETLPATDPFAAFLPSGAGQPMIEQHMLVAFDDKFSSIKPLIDIPALQRHIVYLNSVLQLFKSVDDNFVIRDPTTGIKSPSRPTRVFLSKAVYRYHAWITKCLRDRKGNGALKQAEVPPMDVLVVHHAHMLAPWRYAEDVRMRFPELRHARRFPLDIIAAHIKDGCYVPSQAQVDGWELLTGLPFDWSKMNNAIDVTCPRCSTSSPTSWMSHDGKGLGELGFAIKCPSCGLVVDNDVLATGKFINDLTMCQQNKDCCLASTLFTGAGLEHLETAALIASEIVATLGDPEDNLGEHLSWSMKSASETLKATPSCRITKSKIDEIIRTYDHPSPFSTNLVYKAIVQADFARCTGVWGLFEKSFKNNIVMVLEDSLLAYQHFLKMVLVPGIEEVYPTPSVDLVWHTHQLLGLEYRDHTLNMLGVFVDHLSMEQIQPTSSAFDAAKDSWKMLVASQGLPPLFDKGCQNCGGKGCSQCSPNQSCNRSASNTWTEVFMESAVGDKI